MLMTWLLPSSSFSRTTTTQKPLTSAPVRKSPLAISRPSSLIMWASRETFLTTSPNPMEHRERSWIAPGFTRWGGALDGNSVTELGTPTPGLSRIRLHFVSSSPNLRERPRPQRPLTQARASHRVTPVPRPLGEAWSPQNCSLGQPHSPQSTLRDSRE